ncbi:hypothetical protein ACJIZ3_001409 [Penstemon smallii]|uniref:Hydroxyproline O-arabinosyltransferase-like domain-containing protein n=1 Tax=Penstemon smallii TaxID=265156 RepID=A0ABD3U595_9LAMI
MEQNMNSEKSLEASTSKSPMEQASTSAESLENNPSLEDLMKLLRGKTDSQRLAGLLLVTKFCDKNDQQTILKVYNAVGSTFLHRLLLTGLGKGDNENRQAYLRLSVTVLAAFARVPEITATKDMLAKIALFVEAMSKEPDPSLTEECFEFLFLVSTAHKDGVVTLCESGGLNVLAFQMHTLPDGSHVMELAMKLVQLIISKQPAEKVYVEHPSELSKMVAVIAKQFAVLHNALKFEALHLLSTILSSSYAGALYPLLLSMLVDDWSTSIRVGVMDVLQNRVAPAVKLQALVLAECVISIVGEEWLIGSVSLPDERSPLPADRCILLVLETSRVEIAVILNELAYLKYEANKNSPPDAETFLVKLRDLGVAFSLVERIIKLISKLGENEESNSTSMISEITLTKIIGGLNETVGVALDYLQDAKVSFPSNIMRIFNRKCSAPEGFLNNHAWINSRRIYHEAPHACKEKVKELLGYMLSVEGKDEPSPFHSVCFLLPMLCQITMLEDGCRVFASAEAFGVVVGCLNSLINSSCSKNEDGSTIFLACDTILNFLLKREQLHLSLDNSSSIKLLQALSRWTEDTTEPSVVMMASSICAVILDSTSEEALLCHPDFKPDNLIVLSQLIRRSLVNYGQDLMSVDASSEADLHEIVTSALITYNIIISANASLKQDFPGPSNPSSISVDPIIKMPTDLSSSSSKKSKRLFHTAVTSSDSIYNTWQCRVMYYWFKKQKNLPNSEMGGFTRILHSGKADRFMDEIPTFVAQPLPSGMDQPIPNLSRDGLGAAFPFFYIEPKKYESVLRKFFPEEKGPITNIDPIGNSPVILGKPPWDTAIGKSYIIHYTYGCDYDLQGKMTYGKIGEWRFDKRSYDNVWPPRNLSMPPPGVPESVVTLVTMVNEATANIPNWGS